MISPVIFAGALTIFAGALPPWAPPGDGAVFPGSAKAAFFASTTSIRPAVFAPSDAVGRSMHVAHAD